MQKLGRIQDIQPREVWPDEASHFTPWLCENLDLLSDKLDLPLTFVGREVPVGPYTADVVAETAEDEPKQVVVENQLGPTNHDHLGKVITYGASRNASYLVWIATEFREEHRSALDWLNRTGGGQVGYFGVVLRCIIDPCVNNGTYQRSSPAARKNAARRCRCPRVRVKDVTTAVSRASRSAGAKFARSPYLVWPQTCSAGLRSGA